MAKTRKTVRGMTKFTINSRLYELMPSFLKKGERSVTSDTMMERAVELNANLGEEDGAFILEHQDEIPPEFRRKFYLVFTAWRNHSGPRGIACLSWGEGRWYQRWFWLYRGWGGRGRLVRRCPATNPA